MTVSTFAPPCLALSSRSILTSAVDPRFGTNGRQICLVYRRGRRRRRRHDLQIRAAVDDSDSLEDDRQKPSPDAEGSGSQEKYVPSEEDRPPGASEDVPTELTLAQQLLMKQYHEQVERMGEKECKDLAVEIVRQMFVKDNIMRTMLKKDIDFGVGPPDVDEFLAKEKEKENDSKKDDDDDDDDKLMKK